MTENSASLGVPPRAGPPRNESTSHGGVSTTFQSCQSLAMGAVSAAIRLSSGECRFRFLCVSYVTYLGELLSYFLLVGARGQARSATWRGQKPIYNRQPPHSAS